MVLLARVAAVVVTRTLHWLIVVVAGGLAAASTVSILIRVGRVSRLVMVVAIRRIVVGSIPASVRVLLTRVLMRVLG